MWPKLNSYIAAPRQNLLLLCSIRGILLIGLLLAVLYAYLGLKITLAYVPLLITLTVFFIATVLTLFRLKQSRPVTEPEFFGHLLVDIGSLSTLLYLTGGSNNPFVSYYLVPVCISAATLPWRHTWIVTGLSLFAYSFMLFFYVPLDLLSPGHPHNQHGTLNLHLLGMWLNFAISALLITYFVVRMAHTIRDKAAALQQIQETVTKNEHMLGLAILAAGTAHELATPLSTMSVVLSDMQKSGETTASQQSELGLLQQQLTACKQILQRLSKTANPHSHTHLTAQPIDHYFKQLLDQWQVVRPDAQSTLHYRDSPQPAPVINTNTALGQAVQNLLNNSADASDQAVDIYLGWDETHVYLEIFDRGEGVPREISDNLLKPFVTGKADSNRLGLGLGLYLSHSTIEKFNGTLEITHQNDKGTCTRLTLPIKSSHA